jgi:putative hydrolase of the HAD superfamily
VAGGEPIKLAKYSIKVMLFDLGGVLVHWDGIKKLAALSGGSITEEQSRRFFLESEWVKLFETGLCTPDEFARGVVTELKLTVSADELLQEFISWDRGFYPGAAELLNALKPQFILACLSNNNVLHWKSLCENYGIRRKFHRLYVSHETGLLKPSSAAFEYVLCDMDYCPGEYLFFDDNRECIEKAHSLGINAFQVSGIEEVRNKLKELELLF